jgi:hypothetical protein
LSGARRQRKTAKSANSGIDAVNTNAYDLLRLIGFPKDGAIKMPILHGDFFDDKPTPIAFHAGNDSKVPFEDRVREYIRVNPDRTLAQCAKSLGISQGAVQVACENLVAKGAAEWADEPELEELRRNIQS